MWCAFLFTIIAVMCALNAARPGPRFLMRVTAASPIWGASRTMRIVVLVTWLRSCSRRTCRFCPCPGVRHLHASAALYGAVCASILLLEVWTGPVLFILCTAILSTVYSSDVSYSWLACCAMFVSVPMVSVLCAAQCEPHFCPEAGLRSLAS